MRRRRTGLLVGAVGVVVALVAGLGAFFLLRDDPLTVAGRTVLEPEQVLADAEAALAEYTEDRGGVRAQDTRCWFRLTGPETRDVAEELTCGPVLFVDGDAEQAYLPFPFEVSGGDGDATLTLADEPDGPDPVELADVELLTRPDGAVPPGGSGGLDVPEPPRAGPGFSAEGPFDGVELTVPDGPARLVGNALEVEVTGVAQPERVGSGDDAVRPAEGEVFVAFTYEVSDGEGDAALPPAASYQVDGEEADVVDDDLLTAGTSVTALLSVPADATVELVVSDDGAVQTLSLLDGTPGPGNIVVLARENRVSAEQDAQQQIDATLSAAGKVTETFPFTITLAQGLLGYTIGVGSTAVPADASRGFLGLDIVMENPELGSNGVTPELVVLTLPDGTVLPAVDLIDAPDQVLPAFDVPGDFTAGTVTFRGSFTTGDGVTVDFGGTGITFPITIPAG